jgi:UPF0716 family protein affecting phage T7 exclusion
MPLLFAHHMAVELFGREFSPHGVAQHICVFFALGLILATSAYGAWALGVKALERTNKQRGS